jgi:hypothetical protein
LVVLGNDAVTARPLWRKPLVQRLSLGVVLLAVLLLVLAQAYDGTEFQGDLRATDQEAEEGYFAVGNDTMIVAKPGSSLHRWLRGHVGQRVLVTLQSEPTE